MTISKRIGTFFTRRFFYSGLIALVFVVIAIAIMGLQLLRHPIVGIADNSDFGRISTQVGIYPADPDTKFQYASLTFPFGPVQKVEYLSSELIFCKMALSINHILFGKEFFDIRSLGLIHIVAYSAALLLLAFGLRIQIIPKLIFLSILVFILVDVHITSYFNTFYSESASVIFLLFTVTAMLLLKPSNLSESSTLIVLITFLAFSFLLAFSKSQHLVMLIPLWVFGACCAWRHIHSSAVRWCWVFGTALLMFGGLWWGISSNAYGTTKDTNIKVVLYEEFKLFSPDYRNDLQELNATEDNISRITFAGIVFFYAKHPKRYLELLERRATKTSSHINYGNYTKEESRWPEEQSSKFNLWWHFKAKVYPKQLWFVMGILIGGMFFGTWCYARSSLQCLSHSGLITATLSVMAVCAFLISSTFEANGPEKHLFLFNVLFDLVTVFGILQLYLWSRSARK